MIPCKSPRDSSPWRGEKYFIFAILSITDFINKLMQNSSSNQLTHFAFTEFLANRFNGKHSLNVVFAFHSYIQIDNEIEACTQEAIEKTLRLFQHKLNQFAFGSRSRKKRAGRSTERSTIKEIAFTAAFHTQPHRHVHCQIEIPSECRQSDFSNFIRNFANNNRWITTTNFYIEETKSNIATQKYNSRYGTDTIILF